MGRERGRERDSLYSLASSFSSRRDKHTLLGATSGIRSPLHAVVQTSKSRGCANWIYYNWKKRNCNQTPFNYLCSFSLSFPSLDKRHTIKNTNKSYLVRERAGKI